jgi:hypothetical protein
MLIVPKARRCTPFTNPFHPIPREDCENSEENTGPCRLKKVFCTRESELRIPQIGSLDEQQYSTDIEDFESLRQELLRWREDLPPHLQLEDEVESEETAVSLSNWERRQQSSLRIRASRPISAH